ncbi:hypothetical protein J1605_006512 [Eschrichtius robustus]|uniref:Uncharacterized protein n=1 Tax=Eschrichtius robustus TaxID=9764 RepID=A0AB34H512_ESCRO|nr:hypothetical protein J1605_006512 [Eschrichtius robustus]
MNFSGGKRQEAAGPRDRRAHRSQEPDQDVQDCLGTVHGVISGMWPNCEAALFINGPLALADEIPFFLSFNGVILIPGNADGFLLPKYFKKALQLCPTQKPLSLACNE